MEYLKRIIEKNLGGNMKYKGMELNEITTPQVFDPPKQMAVWDNSNYEPILDTAYAIIRLKNGATEVIGSCSRWMHCANIPDEPKPRRATNRELAKWIAQGNGEWCLKNGTGQIGANTNYGYSTYEEQQNVTDGVLVRKWDDTEWQEPTVDYLGIE